MKAILDGRVNRGIFVIALSLGLMYAAPSYAQDTIGDGKLVSLEYTLTLEDKTVFDTNVGKDPLIYTHGTKQLIPGLEKRIVGLKVGDTKKVEIPPEEGYGPVDPNRFQEVPKENIPEQALGVGKKLQGRGPDGQMIFAQVTEVKDKTVIVNMNHPLAGQKLFFDVKVLKIEKGETQKVEVPGEAAEAKK